MTTTKQILDKYSSLTFYQSLEIKLDKLLMLIKLEVIKGLILIGEDSLLNLIQLLKMFLQNYMTLVEQVLGKQLKNYLKNGVLKSGLTIILME